MVNGFLAGPVKYPRKLRKNVVYHALAQAST